MEEQRLKALRAKEMEDMKQMLAAMDVQRQQQEHKLKEAWRERDRKLWERIESVIKVEEDKVRARVEAERQAREEQERMRRAEEERMKLEEEKKRRADEERQRKVLEERLQKEKEAMARAEREEAERQKSEQEKGADGLRTAAELFRADELWTLGLRTLKARLVSHL